MEDQDNKMSSGSEFISDESDNDDNMLYSDNDNGILYDTNQLFCWMRNEERREGIICIGFIYIKRRIAIIYIEKFIRML